MRKFAPSFDGRRGLVPPQTSFNVTSGSVHCQTTVTPGSELGHSEGSKNSYMDQCTFGAVRPWGGRGAIRKPQSQNSGEPRRRSGPPPVECAQSGLQEGRRAASRLSPLKLLAKRRRGRPWRSLRPSPLAPSLSPRRQPQRVEFLQTVPFFHVPVRAAGADTRAGQSNPAAARTADEAPPRPLDDASIMRRSSRSPAFGDLNATRVSRSRRWPRNFPLQRDRGFRP